MSHSIKWDQKLRFRLIEIVALWEGRLTTNHLREAFQIGRQQASRDINAYISLFDTPPLILDRQLKGYRPSDNFLPMFSQGTASEYLSLLHRQKEMVESFDFFELGHAETETLNVPDRHISPKIVRSLIYAAREQSRVDIDYISLSTPEVIGRNIVPHTIINDGFRWHVRAYCEQRGEYRDFVLSRFRDVNCVLDRSEHGRDQDDDWNTVVTMDVVPNPHLSKQQQAVIAVDYAMKKGQLQIEARVSLVKYVVQRLGICLDEGLLKGRPLANQLTVRDRKKIQSCLIL